MSVIFPLFLSIPIYIFHAFVFKTLYNWFVATEFNLDPIGWAMSFGLVTFISLCTTQHIPRDEDEMGEFYAFAFVAPAFALLIGYFAQASL